VGVDEVGVGHLRGRFFRFEGVGRARFRRLGLLGPMVLITHHHFFCMVGKLGLVL
jgi:hypothetical protein